MTVRTGLLPILENGHQALRTKSRAVAFPDSSLPRQIAQLHATLAAFRFRTGFGRAMAAPQAGIMKRVIVVNLGATPFALINPVITWRSNETFVVWDDCLSLPDCVVHVRRHTSISLKYFDEKERLRDWQCLPPDLSELVQHELDHLDGVLMTARADGEDAIRPIGEHAFLVGTARPVHRLSLDNIARSANVIPAEFLNSPQYDCEPLSEALGAKHQARFHEPDPQLQGPWCELPGE
jgi:peptide deformylase